MESAERPARGRLSRYAIRCFFGIVALLTVCAIGLLLTPSPADDAFHWFGRLGFPDAKGRKFIRVATGHWSQYGGEAPTNRYLDGFLLSESNGAFFVLTKDLF